MKASPQGRRRERRSRPDPITFKAIEKAIVLEIVEKLSGVSIEAAQEAAFLLTQVSVDERTYARNVSFIQDEMDSRIKMFENGKCGEVYLTKFIRDLAK
jgi:hypothetical protein